MMMSLEDETMKRWVEVFVVLTGQWQSLLPQV